MWYHIQIYAYNGNHLARGCPKAIEVTPSSQVNFIRPTTAAILGAQTPISVKFFKI